MLDFKLSTNAAHALVIAEIFMEDMETVPLVTEHPPEIPAILRSAVENLPTLSWTLE